MSVLLKVAGWNVLQAARSLCRYGRGLLAPSMIFAVRFLKLGQIGLAQDDGPRPMLANQRNDSIPSLNQMLALRLSLFSCRS